MIDAMKQALEALDWRFSNADAAIEALRQAIEQAEKQEPEKEKESTSLNVDPRLLLGRNINCTKNIENRLCDLERRMAKIETHPAPPRKEWVGLTDEEIHKIIDDCTPDEAELEELNDFAKAIFAVEAKLKEKNGG
jgi:hypothetical protein